MINKILTILVRFKNLGQLILLLALFGYIIYQFSLVVAVNPDQSYISSQKDKTAQFFQFNKKTINSVSQLLNVSTDTPASLGKGDPFSP